MTDQEIIDVVTAHRDGKAIECGGAVRGTWVPCVNPNWNFGSCDYRVKPEPREWWISCPVGRGPAFMYECKTNAGAQGIHVREVIKE